MILNIKISVVGGMNGDRVVSLDCLALKPCLQSSSDDDNLRRWRRRPATRRRHAARRRPSWNSHSMSIWKWLWPEGKQPKDCPFCILASGSAEGRTPSVLFQDEQIVVFVDRNPSAYRHYLVVPNNHIKTVKDLRPGETDHALVTHMLKLGKSTLQRDAPDAPNYRFGFHRPPFNSVDHLHLHCMALPYNSVWRRLKYIGLGWWGAYVGVERVLQYLDPGKGMKPGVPLDEQPEAPV